MAVQQRHEVPHQEWSALLEEVTKDHAGQDVVIEVLDRQFGDGQQATRLPLAYIEYDHKADELAVAVGGRDGRYPVMLRHAVHRPRRILADNTSRQIDWAFDIVGDDESHTIVTVFARSDSGAA